METSNWIALITNVGTLLSISVTLIIGLASLRNTNIAAAKAKSDVTIEEKKIALATDVANVENTEKLIKIAMNLTQDIRTELAELRKRCDGKMEELEQIQLQNDRLVDVYFQTVRAIRESIEAKEKEVRNGNTAEEASRLADVTLLKRLKELQSVMVNMIKNQKGATT